MYKKPSLISFKPSLDYSICDNMANCAGSQPSKKHGSFNCWDFRKTKKNIQKTLNFFLSKSKSSNAKS